MVYHVNVECVTARAICLFSYYRIYACRVSISQNAASYGTIIKTVAAAIYYKGSLSKATAKWHSSFISKAFH